MVKLANTQLLMSQLILSPSRIQANLGVAVIQFLLILIINKLEAKCFICLRIVISRYQMGIIQRITPFIRLTGKIPFIHLSKIKKSLERTRRNSEIAYLAIYTNYQNKTSQHQIFEYPPICYLYKSNNSYKQPKYSKSLCRPNALKSKLLENK